MVDLVAAVVTDEQPLELVEPGEGPLDHPAVAAEPRAVLGLAPCDLRFDPALPQSATVAVEVVAAVGAQAPKRPGPPSSSGRAGCCGASRDSPPACR